MIPRLIYQPLNALKPGYEGKDTARAAGSVSEPQTHQPFTLLHTLCLSLLGGDGLPSDKVTVVSFYLPSQVDNHLHGKGKRTTTCNLVAVCFGEKSPGGRKGRRGAGSNVLLAVWRPVAAYCVRRDEDVERQRDGFKAWQRLLGFSTAAMRLFG